MQLFPGKVRHLVTVSFRIKDEIKERLDRLAEDRGLNVSHLFRQSLIDKLSELEPRGDVENRFPLTLKERLGLVLQLRTLAAVSGESERESLAIQIEALESGYEFHYRELITPFDNGLSRRACVEVLDILEMHSELYWGYQKLKDRGGIKETDIQFRGFDGNTEFRQMSYGKYFLFDLNRYESLHDSVKKNGCDSHCPMLDTYRRMLRLFDTRKRPPSPLSAEHIKAILAVRGY